MLARTGCTVDLNAVKLAWVVAVTNAEGSNPGGMPCEHAPVPARGGVIGLVPVSVAPSSSQRCSVAYASESRSRIGPPECWISSGRDCAMPETLPSEIRSAPVGTAFISSSG